jgi:hypothetical protein
VLTIGMCALALALRKKSEFAQPRWLCSALT